MSLFLSCLALQALLDILTPTPPMAHTLMSIASFSMINIVTQPHMLFTNV